MHWMPWALVLALLNAGNSIAARMAMMAMTTNSSIKVNAPARRRVVRDGVFVCIMFLPGLLVSHHRAVRGPVKM
jgi:protein-S-isoprenylcysteine O-methyltransferase Ste14